MSPGSRELVCFATRLALVFGAGATYTACGGGIIFARREATFCDRGGSVRSRGKLAVPRVIGVEGPDAMWSGGSVIRKGGISS